MNLSDKVNKKILLVEDEPDLQISYIVRLKIMGFHVESVGDGQTALNLVKKNIPDLVLLDMMIPRFNGFKVCALLKESQKTQHIPIIAVSALKESVFRQKAIDCGADAFFVKPLDWAQVNRKMKILLQLP
ncbi:MAG: response regulator [Candidatus Omnitrophica bacterium]|nr:response regulator [Candidatus Omnitrophota bacterium]